MRATTAYFAGAGTVIVAITAGVGGGFLFADMVAPKTPKPELTRLERNMSAEPIKAPAGPAEPAQRSAAAAPAAPAEPATTLPTQPQTGTANSVPAQTPGVSTAAAVPSAQPAQPAVTPQEPRVAATREDAYAKARDADVKTRDADVKSRDADVKPRDADVKSRDLDVKSRDADVKSREADVKRVEKRKVDRRQQWAERRRYRQPRDQELREVEEVVREETSPREIFAAEPARMELPQIKLFGPE